MQNSDVSSSKKASRKAAQPGLPITCGFSIEASSRTSFSVFSFSFWSRLPIFIRFSAYSWPFSLVTPGYLRRTFHTEEYDPSPIFFSIVKSFMLVFPAGGCLLAASDMPI